MRHVLKILFNLQALRRDYHSFTCSGTGLTNPILYKPPKMFDRIGDQQLALLCLICVAFLRDCAQALGSIRAPREELKDGVSCWQCRDCSFLSDR